MDTKIEQNRWGWWPSILDWLWVTSILWSTAMWRSLLPDAPDDLDVWEVGCGNISLHYHYDDWRLDFSSSLSLTGKRATIPPFFPESSYISEKLLSRTWSNMHKSLFHLTVQRFLSFWLYLEWKQDWKPLLALYFKKKHSQQPPS